MVDIYTGNKKYAVFQTEAINNKDINITTNGNYTPGDGYTGFNVVRVQVPDPTLTSVTVNPSTQEQTITPDQNVDGFNEVIVTPVTASIDANIVAGNIKKDVTILGVTGTFEYVSDDITITPSTLTQVITPVHDGYGTITVQPVTADIDADIIAGNIRQGVNILGVTGTIVESHEQSVTCTENGTYYPDEHFTGFSEVIVDVGVQHTPLNITPSTQRQEYTAATRYEGYSPIIVNPVTAMIDSNIKPINIRQGVSILGVTGSLIESKEEPSITLTQNGTYRPQYPYTGFSEVVVDINTVNNQDITLTQDGTYQPEAPYTGFGTVTVNTTGMLHSKTVTVDANTDTTFTIYPDQGYVGMPSVTVDMSWIESQLQSLNAGDTELTPDLQNKTVTQAGTYTCDNGYDGLGTVTVNLDWVDNQIASIASNFTNTTVDELLSDSLTQLNTDALTIRDYACYQSSSLTQATLTSCTAIGSYAFYGSNLRTLTVMTPSLCTLGTNALPSTITNIYVPSDLVNSYKNATNWRNYTSKISAIS